MDIKREGQSLYLTIKLSEDIERLIVDEAEMMLAELKAMKNSIKLVPAPEPKFSGHLIRVVESRNPDWYSSLYRAHDGKWIRKQCFQALERLSKGLDNGNKYDSVLRWVIMERLIEGYNCLGGEGPYIPPSLKVELRATVSIGEDGGNEQATL